MEHTAPLSGRFLEELGDRRMAGMKRIVKKALTACALLMALLAFPATALAAQPSFSIDSLSTDLYVETDASIHVTFCQDVTFSKPNEGLVWYLHEPETRESIKIESVRVAPIDAQGDLVEEWTELRAMGSSPDLQGRRPGDIASSDLRQPNVRPWYSYDLSDGFMRAYFPSDAAAYRIETNYQLLNRVRMYRDVGELYWRYAHSDMPVDAHNVSLRIALPLPAGEAAIPNDTVLAWGHGPQEGSFVIGEDGSVTYRVDTVLSGHYAESHVLFPASWLANVPWSSPQYRTEMRRAAAVAEEAEWLDSNARGSIWDNKVRVMFGIVAIAALALAIAVVALRGRTVLARRGLVRIAVTLLVITIAEAFFFKEPLTTAFLLVIVIALVLLALCVTDSEESEGEEGQGAEALQTE